MNRGRSATFRETGALAGLLTALTPQRQKVAAHLADTHVLEIVEQPTRLGVDAGGFAVRYSPVRGDRVADLAAGDRHLLATHGCADWSARHACLRMTSPSVRPAGCDAGSAFGDDTVQQTGVIAGETGPADIRGVTGRFALHADRCRWAAAVWGA